jgi:chromate reductase, NAD(P)H dehydrogenase (quinone)
MSHITILSGSPRNPSNTLRVSKAIEKELLKQGYETALIDFKDYDLPNLNQKDIELDNLSGFQQALIDNMRKPGLVFICTPEYNWLPSSELINMINQLAGGKTLNMFDNKVFALAGISAGRGGRYPAIVLSSALNKIIGYFGLKSFVSGKIFEAQFVPKVISLEGDLLHNEEFNNGLKGFVQYSIEIAENWNK